jgi:hypothetical protein
LASDLHRTEFGATGTHLVVSYDIAQDTAPAFNVSVYRSTDGVTRDALVGSREVTLVADRAVGGHTLGVPIDVLDLRKDYRLIAVVDPADQVPETSEQNNEFPFAGGAFLTPDGALHIHGSDAAETVKISRDRDSQDPTLDPQSSALLLQINDWTMRYEATTVRQIDLRLHGGDDALTVHPQIVQNITAFGGDGADRMLTGAGSDWLVGGTGDDFIAGRGNRDLIDGGDGDDTLLGGADNDTLVGMAGNDKLLGGQGRDIVAGLEGADLVDGGHDEDLAWGGKGADRIVNPTGASESRDSKSEDTLLTATPQELLFAEMAADEAAQEVVLPVQDSSPSTGPSGDGGSVELSSATYGFSGTAGPFWMVGQHMNWLSG